jgi:hypothetical protein
MPAEYRSRLIRIYACNKVSAVRELDEYKKLTDEFEQHPNFSSDRNTIEVLKTRVETALDGQMTQRDAVKAAITLLLQTRGNNDKRDLCHELIAVGYRPQWSPAQADYFDHAWVKIKFKYDYFLSFTTRRPKDIVGDDNPVNLSYKQFICSVVDPDIFTKADWKKENLLALAINNLLAQPRAKGYYYPNFESDNAVIKRQLEEACDSCLVFIQLVQTIMFDPPEGTNFCHVEWKRIREKFEGADKESRVIFVVAADNHEAFVGEIPYPFIDYTDWHAHVCEKREHYLPEFPFPDPAKQTKIRDIVRQKVAPEIWKAWSRIVNEVPA